MIAKILKGDGRVNRWIGESGKQGGVTDNILPARGKPPDRKWIDYFFRVNVRVPTGAVFPPVMK